MNDVSWILTTIGKQRIPCFVSHNHPEYEATLGDISVNEQTFKRNQHRLVNIAYQVGSAFPVFAFKEFLPKS